MVSKPVYLAFVERRAGKIDHAAGHRNICNLRSAGLKDTVVGVLPPCPCWVSLAVVSGDMPEALPPWPRLDLVLLASRWICRDIPPEDIPGIAIELLEAGYEEQAVCRLAAEDRVSSRHEVEPLVCRMFCALNVPYPLSQEHAHAIVARQIAREVTTGLKEPWAAAVRLDRVVPHWETNDDAIWAIYAIEDQLDWDEHNLATLEPELLEAFRQLALS